MPEETSTNNRGLSLSIYIYTMRLETNLLVGDGERGKRKEGIQLGKKYPSIFNKTIVIYIHCGIASTKPIKPRVNPKVFLPIIFFTTRERNIFYAYVLLFHFPNHFRTLLSPSVYPSL